MREALQLMKKEGWLYSKNKSRTYISEPDDATILENYRARLALESEILLLAYPSITPEDIVTMKQNCDEMLRAETIADYSKAENKQHFETDICDKNIQTGIPVLVR